MTRTILVSLILLAACGPKPKGEGPRPEDTAVPDGPLAAGQWDTLDKETRAKWMGAVVKPHMKEMFTTFDGEEFSEFDCETCHGAESVASGSFAMPNPDLPKLDGDMIMNPAPDMAAITDFMKTKVRPTMASLLGMPEWSPDAPAGFGCMHCHTPKE